MRIKNINNLEDRYEYTLLNTIEAVEAFVEHYNSLDGFAYDVETTGLDYDTLQLVSLSIYHKILEQAFVIPFNFTADYTIKVKDPNNKRRKIDVGRTYTKTEALEVSEVAPLLKTFFEGKKVIGANIKFDYKVSHKYGFGNFGFEDDTNVMSFYINADLPKGLKESAARVLNIKMTSYADTVKQKVDNINWSEVNWDSYYNYSGFDSYVTYYLRDELETILKNEVGKSKHKNIRDVDSYRAYKEMGLAIIKPTAHMEIEGVKIDVDYLKGLSTEAHKEIPVLEAKIYELAGHEFNIASPKQLGEILFDVMGYKPIKKTASGANATDENTLKVLHYQGHDIASYILQYRKLLKLTGTYIDTIPKIVGTDGRLRGNFNATGTRTSRFSSSKPNLQNQPNNKKYPVRKSFVAEEGNVLIVGDYSQIEFRLLAHFSNDESLITSYLNNEDMHQATADKISAQTGLHMSRSSGKTMNFAIAYLMGAESFSSKLNEDLRDLVVSGEMTEAEYREVKVTKKQAQSMINAFFKVFSGFDKLVERATKYATLTGYMSTLGGFCRPIPDLKSRRTASFGKRKAINTKIQGSAAHLIQLAMIGVFKYMQKNKDLRMLMQVHDELVFECKKENADRHKNAIRRIAEGVFPECKVPIPFDIGIHRTWADSKLGIELELENEIDFLMDINVA